MWGVQGNHGFKCWIRFLKLRTGHNLAVDDDDEIKEKCKLNDRTNNYNQDNFVNKTNGVTETGQSHGWPKTNGN